MDVNRARLKCVPYGYKRELAAEICRLPEAKHKNRNQPPDAVTLAVPHAASIVSDSTEI